MRAAPRHLSFLPFIVGIAKQWKHSSEKVSNANNSGCVSKMKAQSLKMEPGEGLLILELTAIE